MNTNKKHDVIYFCKAKRGIERKTVMQLGETWRYKEQTIIPKNRYNRSRAKQDLRKAISKEW